MIIILQALADDGETAIKLASIITLLVRRGGELGELETYPHPEPDGAPRDCRRLPREWLERLSVAVERGAIATMEPERVVEILLQGRPEPAASHAVA